MPTTNTTKNRTKLLTINALVYAVALAAAGSVAYFLKEMHPVWIVLAADVVATLVVFGFSYFYDNSSLYDPYWSVAPMAIVVFWWWHPMAAEGLALRQWVIIGLVWLWAIRLTWNCMYRWTDMGHEDWRYLDLRAQHGKLFWWVSLGGIHLFPTLLVFGACVPIFPAMTVSAPFGWIDILAIIVTLGAIVIETVADYQLVQFKNSQPPQGSILDTGLWGIVRHPNYLGELLFWWGIYLFGVSVGSDWWWIIIGPLAISALFFFISIPLKDKRMTASRPNYAEHTRKLPALIPNCRRVG